MEIRPDEISELIDDPIDRLNKSFKSPATAEDQTRKLRKVLCEFLGPVLKGDPDLVEKEKNVVRRSFPGGTTLKFSTADYEARAREFVKRAKEDPKWAEAVILKILDKLIERTKLDKKDPLFMKKGAVRNYYFPIQRLLECGGLELPWKRIRRHVPKQTAGGGRAWEAKEIELMLKHCNSEEKPLVILPTTGGMREGGLFLRWEHLKPVYYHEGQYLWELDEITETVSREGKIVCGLIHIYADTEDGDDYITLFTPEAWDFIQEYKMFWINKWGKEPKPKDIFFAKHGAFPRPLLEGGIRGRMVSIQERCGLRPKLPPNARRHEVEPFGGFRKFFDKATKKAISKNSVLGKLILTEKMMGHGGLIPLNKNYFREIAIELIEEYLPAVPSLTILDSSKKQLQLDQAINAKLKAEDENRRLHVALTAVEDLKLEQLRASQRADSLQKELEELRKKSDR